MVGSPLFFANHSNGTIKTVKFNNAGTIEDVKFAMLNNGSGAHSETFGQDGIYDFGGNISSVSYGIFDRLYKNYFGRNFSKTARLTTLTAHLPSHLIVDLKLNDKVIVGNTKYMINSIDTDLTSEITKIEVLNDF